MYICIFYHFLNTEMAHVSSWNIRNHLSCKVNIMADDDLATQGAVIFLYCQFHLYS